MDSVFDLVVDTVKSVVDYMKSFTITYRGFSTNLWDISLGIQFTALVTTLAFPLRRSNENTRESDSSERAPKKGG